MQQHLGDAIHINQINGSYCVSKSIVLYTYKSLDDNCKVVQCCGVAHAVKR